MAKNEIDPQLPFIQLARGVPQKCASLSAILKLPVAHVLGSMCLFWLELSDRRIIGSALPRGMLVLNEAEVSGRLRLCFGQDVVLSDFVLAGFLEPKGHGWYRIRGMSRQLDTEAKRLKIRATAQLNSGSTPGSTQVEPDRGETVEVRGDFASKEATAPTLETAFQTVPADRRVDPLRAQKGELLEDFKRIRGEEYLSSKADWVNYAKLRQTYPHELIRARWQLGLSSGDRWKRISTLSQLLQKWNDLADTAPPALNHGAPPPTPLKRYGKGEDPYAPKQRPAEGRGDSGDPPAESRAAGVPGKGGR